MGEERRWRGKLNKEGREKFAIKVNELNLVERDILKEWKEVEREVKKILEEIEREER